MADGPATLKTLCSLCYLCVSRFYGFDFVFDFVFDCGFVALCFKICGLILVFMSTIESLPEKFDEIDRNCAHAGH
jgi:hypothetical protein